MEGGRRGGGKSPILWQVFSVQMANSRRFMQEAAHERQMYRYKAQYSLDCDNGIEDAVVHRSPTPEEALEDKQLRDQIYTAVMELPGKQAKRIYARFYLDMSVKEIAQVEGVDPRRVRDSIHLGLKKLEKLPPGSYVNFDEESILMTAYFLSLPT